MERGKKSVPSKFLSCVDLVSGTIEEDGLVVFKRALDTSGRVEVRSRRVGGANYQVPSKCGRSGANSLAMRWLVTAARARGEKSMEERLAAEILDEAAESRRRGQETRRYSSHGGRQSGFRHYRW